MNLKTENSRLCFLRLSGWLLWAFAWLLCAALSYFVVAGDLLCSDFAFIAGVLAMLLCAVIGKRLRKFSGRFRIHFHL